jgi:hypothetical protein
MGLFDNPGRRRCYKTEYKNSTDLLLDNLYLLLNRDSVHKLFLMKLIAPDRKTHAGGDYQSTP